VGAGDSKKRTNSKEEYYVCKWTISLVNMAVVTENYLSSNLLCHFLSPGARGGIQTLDLRILS
jgi:hypothetical protein